MSAREPFTEGDINFSDFLSDLDRGRVADELAEHLLEIVAAVCDTKKSGSLTLKVGIGWDKKAEMLRVSTNVAAKAPQLDRPESLFFVTPGGTPTRKDPRQLELLEDSGPSSAPVPVDFSQPRNA